MLDLVEQIIAAGATAGAVRDDIAPTLLTAHLARTFEAAMRDWAEGRVDDAGTHLDMLLDLAFDGLRPP